MYDYDIKNMQETSNYLDFLGAEIARELGKTHTKSPRIICPECFTHIQDDTLDCKNLYTHPSNSIGCTHSQCLCYSREHGIRIETIDSMLGSGIRKEQYLENNPQKLPIAELAHQRAMITTIRKYLFELLEYQLQQPHQSEWYQNKVNNIYEKHHIKLNYKTTRYCVETSDRVRAHIIKSNTEEG